MSVEVRDSAGAPPEADSEPALKRKKKKGEVESLTEQTSDFREGIEGTKSYLTCEDVIKKLRSEGRQI